MTYTRWLIEPLSAGEGGQRERERALAYDILCRLLDGEHPRLEHDEKGAPYLPEHPELSVSISHCRKAVAVAVSEKYRIGIDIESRRKVSPSLMERVCTDDELAKIRSSADPTMTFLRFWTRKEAVLKMQGTGIRGFGSMVEVSEAANCTIEEIDCGLYDTVAALATAL